jgi:hypothetical protein
MLPSLPRSANMEGEIMISIIGIKSTIEHNRARASVVTVVGSKGIRCLPPSVLSAATWVRLSPGLNYTVQYDLL